MDIEYLHKILAAMIQNIAILALKTVCIVRSIDKAAGMYTVYTCLPSAGIWWQSQNMIKKKMHSANTFWQLISEKTSLSREKL